MFILMLLPGGGDELQGIKRGIVELADLILVNKSDGNLLPVAQRSVADYRNALHLLHPRSAHWQVPVEGYSALEGSDTPRVWDIVERYRTMLSDAGELEQKRGDQAKAWMWSEVTDALVDELKDDPDVKAQVSQLEDEVTNGKMSPTVAAQELITAFPETPDWRIMIGRLNHVAIAVPDINQAVAVYEGLLGATVSPPVRLPVHGVTTVFVELPNTKIELLHPLGEGSPIERFLERNPCRRNASRLLRSGRHYGRPRQADRRGRQGPGQW